MTKKLLVLAVALSLLGSARAWSEDKAPKAPKEKPAKVYETRIHESDMNRLTDALDKAIKGAIIAKQGPVGFEYTAKKMKPPKNEKWIEKWNELGAEGWEYVDHFENIYIFKRIAVTSAANRVKPASAPDKAEPAAADSKADKKAAKEQEKADKKALKDQEKAEKKAAKEQEKAAKKAEKEQKKAAKKAEKEKAKKIE